MFTWPNHTLIHVHWIMGALFGAPYCDWNNTPTPVPQPRGEILRRLCWQGEWLDDHRPSVRNHEWFSFSFQCLNGLDVEGKIYLKPLELNVIKYHKIPYKAHGFLLYVFKSPRWTAADLHFGCWKGTQRRFRYNQGPPDDWSSFNCLDSTRLRSWKTEKSSELKNLQRKETEALDIFRSIAAIADCSSDPRLWSWSPVAISYPHWPVNPKSTRSAERIFMRKWRPKFPTFTWNG